ncbi:MAG: EF-P lysine aminoacylase EpmA [Thermodesulfobacteriota bacterium]|nr:EF-P lysine aminoacylase EpmA [Thermodesulfobacteriota bacterium]
MDERLSLRKRKKALTTRAKMIQAIRRFFTDRDYLEIETPLRVPTLAPESHIDAIPSDGWFLHTSPELCMKRLLAAGFPRIFQISHCFRKGERGRLHVSEFALLEWYRAGIDYLDMMDECEDLFIFVAGQLGFGKTIKYQGKPIDLTKPWERISVKKAFEAYSSLSPEEAIKEGRFDEIMVGEIEPNLGENKPSFLYDYPVSLGSLARVKKEDPSVAERFEIYAGGLELANAFSELTDAKEQRKRFQKEDEFRRRSGKTAYPVPEKFLDALSRMPESSGIALGVDRLAMIFTDSSSIDEVVAFTPEEL